MKKIISLTLITIMILAATVLPSFAAETDVLTREEAESLLIEGYQRLLLVYHGSINFDGVYLKKDSIKGEAVLKTATLKYETSAKGVKYSSELIDDHRWVTDERFDTMEKCYAYTGEVFVDELSKKIIDENPYVGWARVSGTPVECFRPSEGGRICYYDTNEWVDSEAGKVVYFYTAGTDTTSGNVEEILTSIGDITVNGDTATMKVTIKVKEAHGLNGEKPEGAEFLYSYSGEPNGVYLVPHEEVVTFKKTSDGWHISGGSFFEILMLNEETLSAGMKRYLGIAAVSTGDTTATTAALFATIALAAVITPFALSKKRRVR